MCNSSFSSFASHSILPTNKFLELDFFGSKTKGGSFISGGSFIDLVTDVFGESGGEAPRKKLGSTVI